MSEQTEKKKSSNAGIITLAIIALSALSEFDFFIGIIPLLIIFRIMKSAGVRKQKAQEAGDTNYQYSAKDMKADLSSTASVLTDKAQRAFDEFFLEKEKGKNALGSLESALNLFGEGLSQREAAQDDFYATRDYDGDAVKRSADMVGIGDEASEMARLSTELNDLLKAGIIDRAEYNDRLREVGVRVRA